MAETPARTAPRNRYAIATYGSGRTCEHPECETTISRYNKAAMCWRHAQEQDRRSL
jgi:hypothetical protein